MIIIWKQIRISHEKIVEVFEADGVVGPKLVVQGEQILIASVLQVLTKTKKKHKRMN